MANITDYVKSYGNYAFSEMPFSEVDSLILSQLSYLNFCDCNNTKIKFSVKISDLAKLNHSVLTEKTPLSGKTLELLAECAKSKRFGEIGVSFFESDTDEKCEKQFSAVTFKLGDKLFYIAYRGTDATIIGWKEDFNLSYLKKIPSQTLSLSYFKKVAKKTKGKVILGGHSKGGNLAVFSACLAPFYLKRRIESVYCHDGPGFLDENINAKKLSYISSKLKKTVPQMSLVGLLFRNCENFTIIESKAFGIFQHNPFSWQVEKNSFKTCKEINVFAKTTADRINSWLKNTETEKIKLLVDRVYEVVSASGAKTYFELFDNKNSSLKKIYKAIKDTDPEVREIVKSLIKVLQSGTNSHEK